MKPYEPAQEILTAIINDGKTYVLLQYIADRADVRFLFAAKLVSAVALDYARRGWKIFDEDKVAATGLLLDHMKDLADEKSRRDRPGT